MIEDIGKRVRQLRKHKSMSMAELANDINASKSLISQVERGEVYPSLTTLEKIATALDVSIDKFFEVKPSAESEAPNIVVRANAQKIVYIPDSQTKYHVLTPSLYNDNDMEFLLIEYPPQNEASDYFSHEGKEYFYVLEGELEMTVANNTYYIKAGDSGCFDSDLRHYFVNHTDQVAKIIIAAYKSIL